MWSSSLATASLALHMSTLPTPASPCTPSPISILSSATVKSAPWPGRLQGDSARPIVPMLAATSLMVAVMAARLQPIRGQYRAELSANHSPPAALLGHGARDLEDEHGAAQPAAARALVHAGEGAVLAAHEHLHLQRSNTEFFTYFIND